MLADTILELTLSVDVRPIACTRCNGNGVHTRVTTDLTDVRGRNLIVVGNIIESGLTLNLRMSHIQARYPASIEVCTLVDERSRRIRNLPEKYVWV